MIKLLSTLLMIISFFHSSAQAPRALDQPMKAKSCTIKVEANAFIAKTFVELEYENPQDIEIEGVEYFSLKPGQVITAFQLDLHGKYRDGSIEEKWKANNAYNSIVGKRIDPALLQMHGENQYRLNIYPFTPKGRRKVTFTVVEILRPSGNCLDYELPLDFFQSVGKLNIEILVHGGKLQPHVENGLLLGQQFVNSTNPSRLHYELSNLSQARKLRFCIPQAQNDQHFVSGRDGKRFGLRLYHDVPRYFQNTHDQVAIFWDISSSAQLRNIEKEISFLRNYVHNNRINEIELYTFNQSLQFQGNYKVSIAGFTKMEEALKKLEFSGSTDMGVLDFSKIKSNTAMVFSDGRHTRGNHDIQQGTAQVHWVISSSSYNLALPKQITEWSGGNIINLAVQRADSAIYFSRLGENMLYDVRSNNQRINIDQSLPVRGNHILISGESAGPVELNFGNNLKLAKRYEYGSINSPDSNMNTVELMQMIHSYEKIRTTGDWRALLVFGIENKIVTSNTAFIVLERIEDYIKYKIEPPKELEEQCRELNYVYSTPHRKRQIQSGALVYLGGYDRNQLRQKALWGHVTRPAMAHSKKTIVNTAESGSPTTTGIATNQPGAVPANIPAQPESSIAEVVVTSAFNTKRTARSVASNVQTVNSEQLNLVRGSNLNNALAGRVAGIQVRSQSGVALGRETFVRLRGRNSLTPGSGVLYVVDGTIMPNSNEINPDDIEDLTVLQAPAATALFGPDGSNGAIVINSKRAKKSYNYYYDYSTYRLADARDIEYIEEIRNAGVKSFFDEYKKHKNANLYNPAFYLDVAELFYEHKLKHKALQILDEGIEMGGATDRVLVGAAYLLESWGEFKQAIELYKQAIVQNRRNGFMQKDLALCYFQDGQYQLALDKYIEILNEETEYYDYSLKQCALNEMNALISLHRYSLDISKVDTAVIKDYPADLYISMGSNTSFRGGFSVQLPSGHEIVATYYHWRNNTKNLFTNENEFFIKSAYRGTYRIIEPSSYRHYYTPAYSRIIVFKNYQRPGQKIEIQHIQTDGQYGSIEVGTVTW